MIKFVDVARENLTIQELELILADKKIAVRPVVLTEDEKLHQHFVNELTKGVKPKLYPPKINIS